MRANGGSNDTYFRSTDGSVLVELHHSSNGWLRYQCGAGAVKATNLGLFTGQRQDFNCDVSTLDFVPHGSGAATIGNWRLADSEQGVLVSNVQDPPFSAVLGDACLIVNMEDGTRHTYREGAENEADSANEGPLDQLQQQVQLLALLSAAQRAAAQPAAEPAAAEPGLLAVLSAIAEAGGAREGGAASRANAEAAPESSLAAEESEADDDDDQLAEGSAEPRCTVCHSARANATFVHGQSGHTVCCFRCAKRVHRESGKCPICRERIDLVLRNYTN